MSATKEMKSLTDFIAENNITMTVRRADRNPNWPDNLDGFHYACILSRTFEGSARYTNLQTGETKPRTYTKRMTVPFSTGSGWTREPSAADVLGCLSDDSASIKDYDFEEWCSNLGYDTDSRKAEKTYKACERQAAKLEAFLGSDLYETLLYNTERE